MNFSYFSNKIVGGVVACKKDLLSPSSRISKFKHARFGANPVPDQDTVLKSFKSFAKDPALKIVMKSASVVLRKAKLRVMSNGNGSSERYF